MICLSVTVACDGNTEMTITDDGVRVHGNLTVDGTQTIINTTTLSVEDNVIELNRSVSANAAMRTYSGLKINRGEVSTTTEQDLYWVWNESFADDGKNYVRLTLDLFIKKFTTFYFKQKTC